MLCRLHCSYLTPHSAVLPRLACGITSRPTVCNFDCTTVSDTRLALPSPGDLDAAGDRTSPACKVAYPNRDTYFGPYAAGAKSGTGLYVAASGAAYAGQYAGGKRCGFGLMVLPDGGLYKGGFKDDKFDGQVRSCCLGWAAWTHCCYLA